MEQTWKHICVSLTICVYLETKTSFLASGKPHSLCWNPCFLIQFLLWLKMTTAVPFVLVLSDSLIQTATRGHFPLKRICHNSWKPRVQTIKSFFCEGTVSVFEDELSPLPLSCRGRRGRRWWRNHLPHYALPNLNPNPRPLFLFLHSSQKGRSSEAVCSLLQRHCCYLFLTMLLMYWAESASCVFSTELDFCFKPVFPTLPLK